MTSFTFGRTNTGNTNGGLSGNYKWASKFTCNDTGQVIKISLYVTADTGIWTGKAAIYSDNAGTPNALLGTSNAVTVNTIGWWDFLFSVPIPVTSTSVYWLAIISGDLMSYGVSTAVSNFCYNADTYTDGFSDPFGAKTDVAYEACIYATGVTGGAECVLDSDCVALHGADWICVGGVCVYSPPPPIPTVTETYLGPFKNKRVRVTVDNTLVSVADLTDFNIIRKGGVESKYGMRGIHSDRRHCKGKKYITFVIRRWYKTDIFNQALFFNLHNNNTEFEIEQYLNGDFSVGDLIGIRFLECRSYKHRFINGNANDIIGEEISGSGTSFEAIYYECPIADDLILNSDFGDGFTNWSKGSNIAIVDGYPTVDGTSINLVLNGSFGDGLDNWSYNNVELITDDGADDNYSIRMSSSGAWISQTYLNLITEGRSGNSVLFLAKGEGVVRVTIYFADGSTPYVEDISIAIQSCSDIWLNNAIIPPCIPFYAVNISSKNVSSIKFEWVSGDFKIDSITNFQNIDSGWISQTFTSPISVPCLCLFKLLTTFKGYYQSGCTTFYVGSMDVIFIGENGETTFHYTYSSNNTWQNEYTSLSSLGQRLYGIKIILYTGGEYDISCSKVEMQNE